MNNSHPAVRRDDLRRLPSPERKKRARDRIETVKRLHGSDSWHIMNALRMNGLYSHRTSDHTIMRMVEKVLRQQGIALR